MRCQRSAARAKSASSRAKPIAPAAGDLVEMATEVEGVRVMKEASVVAVEEVRRVMVTAAGWVVTAKATEAFAAAVEVAATALAVRAQETRVVVVGDRPPIR